MTRVAERSRTVRIEGEPPAVGTVVDGATVTAVASGEDGGWHVTASRWRVTMVRVRMHVSDRSVPTREGDRMSVRLKRHDALGTVAGTVVETTPHHHQPHLEVTLDNGDEVVLPQAYVGEHLEPGYATTIHKAQGATVDVGLVYAPGISTGEVAYVAMSRGRGDAGDGPHTNRLYVPAANDLGAEARDDRLSEIREELVQCSGPPAPKRRRRCTGSLSAMTWMRSSGSRSVFAPS